MNLSRLGTGVVLIGVMLLGTVGGRGIATWWRAFDTPPMATYADHSVLLQAADADLVLFSLSTCRYCRDARDWLGRHQVAFVELVVDESEVARQAFAGLGEPALPVLVGPDRRIRGFAPDAYAELIAQHHP